MSETISITMSALARASQYLNALGAVKKEGAVALDLSNYRVAHVDVAVKNFQDAETGVFKNHGIEADDKGALQVEKTDENYEVVVAELAAVRTKRVDIPAFPVTLERLTKSADKFEDNPINENILIGLNVLFTGEPEETVH